MIAPEQITDLITAGLPVTEDIAEAARIYLEHASPYDFKDGDPERKVSRDEYYTTGAAMLVRLGKSLKRPVRSYCGFIQLYSGRRWFTIDKDPLSYLVKEYGIKLGIPEGIARNHKFVTDFREQLYLEAFTYSPKQDPDKPVVNFQNGTLEIFDNRFREHRSQDGFTYVLPYDYQPDAKCPKWLTFLDQVLPDKQGQQVLAEFIGSMFAREMKTEKALFMYGDGANGKSVAQEVIVSALGNEKNISSYTLEKLVADNGNARAGFMGKLANISPEIGNRLLSNDTLKRLISREPVDYRKLYKDIQESNDYGRLWFNANRLPVVKEHSEAFFRRFIIMPFNVTIPKEKRDKYLAKRIVKDELPGVFNWILKGLSRLLEQQGFSKYDAGDKALAEYQKVSNNVALFIEEMGYSKSLTEKIFLKDLYSAYKHYCESSGYYHTSYNEMSDRLRSMDYEIVKVGSKSREVFMTLNEGDML